MGLGHKSEEIMVGIIAGLRQAQVGRTTTESTGERERGKKPNSISVRRNYDGVDDGMVVWDGMETWDGSGWVVGTRRLCQPNWVT